MLLKTYTMGPERKTARERPNFFPGPEVLEKRLEESPYKDDILFFLEKYDVPVEDLLVWPERKSTSLSDLGILRHFLAGNIVIDPFRISQLTPNSYDVALGEYFFREGKRIEHPPILESPRRLIKGLVSVEERYEAALPTYNPFDPENVEYCWREDKPIKVKDLSERQEEEIVLEGVKPEDRIIILRPLENIIGCTEEFIGGENVVYATISARSSTGRSMLEVCNDANLGHVGFRSRWALEIKNKLDTHATFLVVGHPYAQLSFFEIERSAQSYRGSFQRQFSLEEDKATWEPKRLLAQLRREENSQPEYDKIIWYGA